MNKTFMAMVLSAAGAGIAGADPIEDRVRALEERLKVAEEPSGGGSGIDLFFKNGLQGKSRDGNFEIRIGGRVILHYREYVRQPERVSRDSFALRETKLDVRAKLFRDFGGRVEINGTGSQAFVIDEGWVSWERWSFLKVKVGQYKAPFSVEQTTSTLFIDMPERGPSDRLVPGYELGAMVYGEIVEKVLEYNLMVANGTLKAAENNSDKDLHARLQLRPFARMESDFVRGVHLAIAGNWGKRGLAAGTMPYTYSAPSTQTPFVANGPRAGQVRFDQDRYRFDAEVAWLLGPAAVKAEFLRTRDTYRFPGENKSITNHSALFVTASCFLTGEAKNWERPAVKKPLFGPEGGFGAVELVARYSRFRIGDDLFRDGVLSRRNSAKYAEEYAGCVNWYPNANVRLSVMYAWLNYTGDSVNPVVAGGRRFDHEDVIVVRAQIDF